MYYALNHRENLFGQIKRFFGVSANLTVVFALAILILAPITAILVSSLGSVDSWLHLFRTVLPRALITTLTLIIVSGILTLVIGAVAGWLISVCDFPGRTVLGVLLVLPLAIPVYIFAYSYGEILDYTGIIQTGLRYLFGWSSIQDYWFPNIRSLPGAILIMTIAFYPYVFITARAVFSMQSATMLDAARTLGAGPWRLFIQVGIPLARPALIAGLSLASMEILNDIGAVRYLGVQTLTASIYDTWLNRNNLTGAAQIACVMMLFIGALLLIERRSRALKSYKPPNAACTPRPKYILKGWQAFGAMMFCFVPVFLGFIAPVWFIISATMRAPKTAFLGQFWQAASNSLILTAITMAVVITLGITILFIARFSGSRLLRQITGATIRLSSISYAIPGTILAIGVLIPLLALDRLLSSLVGGLTGAPMMIGLIGAGVGLIYAYSVRFLAPALGALETGMHRLPMQPHDSARTLGACRFEAIIKIDLPMIKSLIGAAALMVMLDCLKELPATLILRTFNFETLATLVFSYADNESFRYSAPAALAIIALCLIPAVYLGRFNRLYEQ